MKYFLLNGIDLQHCETPELLKVPELFFSKMKKCIYHNQLANKYERECIEILSRTNKLSTSEIDDLMAVYDWGVDQLSYGSNVILFGEIAKEEYLKLQKAKTRNKQCIDEIEEIVEQYGEKGKE